MDISLNQLKHHVAEDMPYSRRLPTHLVQVDRKTGAWSTDGHRAFLVLNQVDDSGEATSDWEMAEGCKDADTVHFDPRETVKLARNLEDWGVKGQAAAAGTKDGKNVIQVVTVDGRKKTVVDQAPDTPIPYDEVMASSVGAFTAVFNLRTLHDLLTKMKAVADSVDRPLVADDPPYDHHVTVRLVGQPDGGKTAQGSREHRGFRLHLAAPGSQSIIMDIDQKQTPATEDRMSTDRTVPVGQLSGGSMFALTINGRLHRFVLMEKDAKDHPGLRQAVDLEDGSVHPLPDATHVAPMNIGGEPDE